MGWLHAGHRSLIARSRNENPTTVMTLFVNPKQFNSAEDLVRYPRNEPRDLAIAAEEGVDLVFAPGVEEVYPPGFETTVSVGRLATVLEGAARPGHFDGVATVVTILFNLAGADVAYFGQKDAQQAMVITRMARDLGVPLEGITGPLNAITDVKGVEVGYATLQTGAGKLQVGTGPVRTGVTAVLPRGIRSR